MNDGSQRLTPQERQSWPGAEPTPGFAEHVARAWQQERQRPRPALPIRWALWSGCVAAVLVSLLWWSWIGQSFTADHGEVTLTTRRTVELSERATVVGEPGTHLKWTVDSSGVGTVVQHSGRAFYRVEPGPAFRVQTPAGHIDVVGTCFSVEIETMSNTSSHVRGAAAGALVAAVATVIVYEGKVVASEDDHDAIELSAGEQARIGDGRSSAHLVSSGSGTPLRFDKPPPANASAKELVAYANAQHREIERLRTSNESHAQEVERLRARVRELDDEAVAQPDAAAPPPTDPQEHAKKCASAGPTEGCPFVEPNQATLLEMAKCGTVRVDYPSFLSEQDPIEFPPETVAEYGWTDNEYAQIISALSRYRDDVWEDVREQFVDAGAGTPEQAEDMGLSLLDSAIENAIARREIAAIRNRVSRERAGLDEPPPDPEHLSSAERWVRAMLERGSGVEEAIASVVGARRARAARLHNDGWPGHTSVWSGKCGKNE